MEKSNNLVGMSPPAFPKRILIVILRLFFKLLYHQFAWTYDWVASIVSLGSWQKWVTSVVPYLHGPRILEIGFGPGHLQVARNQEGISIFGLDESHQMVHIAHRNLTHLGLRSNLIRGDSQTLPFSGNNFDQVVMTFPAEYIFNPSSLTEIHRVLADGGMAIILPMAWITGRKPLERLVSWVNRITGEAPEWDENVLKSLETAGFEVSWEMKNFTNSKVLMIRLLKPMLQNMD
jgi:ubiquinone/menaquinone biosynthesis C-methylase UbiE